MRRYHRDLEGSRDRYRLERQLDAMCAPASVRSRARALLFFYDLSYASDWLEQVAGVQDDPEGEARFAQTARTVAARLRAEGAGRRG